MADAGEGRLESGRSPAARQFRPRYWVAGALVTLMTLACLYEILFSRFAGVCHHKTATILAVALSIGNGIGYLGSELTSRLSGNDEGPRFSRSLAYSLVGGIAAFAIAAFVSWTVVDRTCARPLPPCSQYASDGLTCARCIVPVDIHSVLQGSDAGPGQCEGMRKGASIRIEFVGLMHIDEQRTGGRQIQYQVRSHGRDVAETPLLREGVRAWG